MLREIISNTSLRIYLHVGICFDLRGRLVSISGYKVTFPGDGHTLYHAFHVELLNHLHTRLLSRIG